MPDISNNLDIQSAKQEREIINFLKEHGFNLEDKVLFLTPEEKFKPKRSESPGKTRKRIRERKIEEKKGKPLRKKGGKWTRKYKKSINCKKPKGFSQKQYCKYGRKTR